MDDIRFQLVTLARRSKARKIGLFEKGMPSKWKPHSVVNPESGEVFTDAGAWDFIACLLENGHPMEEIILDRPPGRKAYVLLVDIKTDSRPLYIKIQLGSGVIWGRSFHYSEYFK